MTTVLVTPAELSGDVVELAGGTYRHLFRALRLAVGDRLRVTDGAGRARWAEVTAIDRATGSVRLGAAAPLHLPAVDVHLLVAAPKKERAAWLVEKATELGVAAVRFVETRHGARDFGAGTLRRLGRVAAAALEQSHGSRLPELGGTHPWTEVAGLLTAAGDGAARWMLDTGDLEADRLVPGADGVAVLLIGPEGGWSDAERADLTDWGCTPASLGPTVLRVETAALAGAALLLAHPVPARPVRGHDGPSLAGQSPGQAGELRRPAGRTSIEG